jgi:hypothetical protein
MGDLICDGGECSTAVAELGVVPATLPFYLVEGASNSPGLIMIISNSGTAPLVFEIQAEVPWVSTDVSTGALPPNAEQEVSIAVDGTGLSAGESSPS